MNWLLEELDERGATAVIPPTSNRRHQRDDDADACKGRHLVENYWLSLQAVCVHVMFFVKSEGWIDMDHKQFQEWLSGIDHLSPAQRQQTEAVFLGDTETSASLAAIEAAVGEDRQCPHCGTPGAISRGKARGSATVPVQRMQEDIQCRDRHPFVGSAPQGQVAFLRSLSC